MVSAAASMSSCASELCAKNTGYSAVQITVADGHLRSCATLRASRHTPKQRERRDQQHGEARDRRVKALNFHQNASHSISSGGCALESVVCGMSDPVSSRSRAAGMKYPASSQK